MPLQGLGVRKDVIGLVIAALPDGLPWKLTSSLTGAGITGVILDVPISPLLGPEQASASVIVSEIPAPLTLVLGAEVDEVKPSSTLLLIVLWVSSGAWLTFLDSSPLISELV